MKASASEKRRFESAVREANEASFQGWDFTYLGQYGGNVEEPTAWCYKNIDRDYFTDRNSVLDLGTEA